MFWIALFLVLAVGGFLFYLKRAKHPCCCGSSHEKAAGKDSNDPKKPGCCS